MTGDSDDADDLSDVPSTEQGGAPGAIRALTRGLGALEALNRQPNASVTEIAGATGLARTTAYRVRETLCAAGLALRTADERYQLLPGVYRLSDGLDDEPWIARIAKPAVAVLAKDLAWPLWLAIPHGCGLKAYPLADGPGLPARLPLTASAAGLAYLAALAPEQRAAVLEVAKTMEAVNETLDATLADVSAIGSKSGGAARMDYETEIGLAVPVRVAGGVIASLAVTLPRSALADQAPEQALDRITALLTHAAAELAAAFAPNS